MLFVSNNYIFYYQTKTPIGFKTQCGVPRCFNLENDLAK